MITIFIDDHSVLTALAFSLEWSGSHSRQTVKRSEQGTRKIKCFHMWKAWRRGRGGCDHPYNRGIPGVPVFVLTVCACAREPISRSPAEKVWFMNAVKMQKKCCFLKLLLLIENKKYNEITECTHSHSDHWPELMGCLPRSCSWRCRCHFQVFVF